LLDKFENAIKQIYNRISTTDDRLPVMGPDKFRVIITKQFNGYGGINQCLSLILVFSIGSRQLAHANY